MLRGLLAAPPNHYLSGERRPVFVVPGVWESWTFLVTLIKPLHVAGHPVHMIGGVGCNTRSVVEITQKLADDLETHNLHDAVVVAPSKGRAHRQIRDDASGR